MKKMMALFLVYMMLLTSFLADFRTGKVEASRNFISIDDSFCGFYVNSHVSTDYWINYNDGYADDAFGLTDGGVITIAVELTDIELAPYREYLIDKLNVAFGSENNPPGEIVDYTVWIQKNLPSNPYDNCINIVATGTSTGAVWNIIDVTNTHIPDTGNIYVGINIEYVSGQYPCGMDQDQSGPMRASLIAYPGVSWTNLFTLGYSSVWCLDVGIYFNNPPNTPSYLNPSSHDTNVDINANLIWTCNDPEDDELKYDIYFGTSSNPPLISHGRSEIFYDPPEAMNYNTKYYWQIVAEDEYGASTTGPIWDFTTSSEPNNPPYTPSNPYPENGLINIVTITVLNWTGGDPDAGDTVTYDVFFGGMLPIQKIATNISNTSINPGNLVNGLNYFWNVVSWDNHNASTIGPSWHFTTINPNNRPPNKPSKPSGQTKGKIRQNYSYTTSTTDPEGDQLYYNWSWGDGTYSGWIGPYNNGEIINKSHSWTEKGNYNIKVKAKDILGLESEWSDPVAIRMPKTDPITNCIEAFYLYIGKIRNLTIVQSEGRDYYQWYAVQMFAFWIYNSPILRYEIGLKIYNDDAFYFFMCPIDEFHGKINSDSISGYYLWI